MFKIKGKFTLPGDKSISHRMAMFASISDQTVRVENYSQGEDNLTTLSCMKALNVEVVKKNTSVKINGVGKQFPVKKPLITLDTGNSGTTTRLICGILAGQNFETILSGDRSLNSRPMKRISDPLMLMGAKIELSPEGTAPIHIFPSELTGIDYASPVASAQVKSCILLAGLYAAGETSVTETATSRDHTERLLKLVKDGNKIISSSHHPIHMEDMFIPGDISSAAFLLILCILSENSHIVIENVSLNETRTGILDVLRNIGIEFILRNEHSVNNEDLGNIEIYGRQKTDAFHLKGDIIPNIIDEIPILAVLAALSNGETIIEDIEELRYKESDRIAAIEYNLKQLGVSVYSEKDKLVITGQEKFSQKANLKAFHDHRIAMAFHIASLFNKEKSNLDHPELASVSFPNFYQLLKDLSI
jgi:3-phosphoshikimate 1-carboxyvinyltransferase